MSRPDLPAHLVGMKPSPTTSVRQLLDRLEQSLTDNQSLSYDEGLHLIDALRATLAFPTFTRDMVSRGHVAHWLYEAAEPHLAKAVGGDAL